MKKYLFISLLLVLLPIAGMAQQKKPAPQASAPSTNKQILEKLERIDSLLEEHSQQLDEVNINASLKNRFKLYPTENIYNFLLLDTRTGRIWQMQWSMESDNEGCVPIVDFDLVSKDESYGSNVFELYPTKNFYQFLLINKTNGRTWHVQWGMESEKRWIKEISNPYLPKETEK